MNWIKNHKKLTIVLAIIFLFGLVGSTLETQKEAPKEQTENTEQRQEAPEQKVKPVFDIPALIGEDIDDVRTALGQPSDKSFIEPTEQQKQQGMGAEEWNNSYKKDGQELIVTFIPDTRRVVDFFISGTDKNKLLEIGGIDEDDASYRVELIKSLVNEDEITGIKVIPN